MIQEFKELLLKDLCARLPYGVKVQIPDKYGGHTSIIKNIDIDGYVVDSEGDLTEIEWAKPYLFPLSSMTEEQKKVFDQCIELELKAISGEIDHTQSTAFEVDFYNKHHFDWRGLIPLGLAIDATGLNIY